MVQYFLHKDQGVIVMFHYDNTNDMFYGSKEKYKGKKTLILLVVLLPYNTSENI